MITVNRIERLFSDQQHPRLYRELIAGRPEATFALQPVLARAIPIATLGMLRLDELSQANTALYRRLRNVVLTAQNIADGGWSDPLTTSLALRAMLSGSGDGATIARGLHNLARLQHDDGLFPRENLHRMPADPFVSAFVMLQLGDHDPFRQSVRFHEAVEWFTRNATHLDPDTRRLWSHAHARCRSAPGYGIATLWTTHRPAA